MDLGEKSQYPPKSLQSVLGGSPLHPSSLHLILWSLICLSLLFVVLGLRSPAQSPSLRPQPMLSFFLVSSALLASFVPCCLWGRGLQRTFRTTLHTWCTPSPHRRGL